MNRLEIVATVFLVAVVCTLVLLQNWMLWQSVDGDPKEMLTTSNMAALGVAMDRYMLDCGIPAPAELDATVLHESPESECWEGPYVDLHELKDGWGTAIRVSITDNEKCEIRSAGADHAFETEDDIGFRFMNPDSRPTESDGPIKGDAYGSRSE